MEALIFTVILFGTIAFISYMAPEQNQTNKRLKDDSKSSYGADGVSSVSGLPMYNGIDSEGNTF